MIINFCDYTPRAGYALPIDKADVIEFEGYKQLGKVMTPEQYAIELYNELAKTSFADRVINVIRGK